MTYQVLARKWRPRDFASLVGQEHVVRALTHALDQQRLHHAYLFTGTRGVGKTTLSRILAKALNCETGITSTPCGVCSACTEIDAGRFVDYLEMDAASNRGVDEMAALLERAVYAPADARFKVYMIDEVHMLTNHAFNAMLKTLEEPPPHVKFILATTDPQKIPVTVLSRCLQFNLKQMPAAQIVSHLGRVLEAETIAFEPQALRLLARAADGSMRDALSLTDQAIAYSSELVSEAAVRGMLGTLDQHYLAGLLDALVAADADAVLAIADEMAARSLSFSLGLQEFAGLLHRIAWAQFAPGSVLDEWPEAEDVRRFAQTLSPEQVQLYYQIATLGRAELGLAPDEYAGFTMTLLRMLAFRPLDSVPASFATPPGARTLAAPRQNSAPVAAQAAALPPVEMKAGKPTPSTPTLVESETSAPIDAAKRVNEPRALAAENEPQAMAADAEPAPIAGESAAAGTAEIETAPVPPPAEPSAEASRTGSLSPAQAALAALRGGGGSLGAGRVSAAPRPVRAAKPAGRASVAVPAAPELPSAANVESAPASVAAVAEAPGIPVSLAALGIDDDWPALAARLPIKGLAAQLAQQSELIALDGDQLILNVQVETLVEGPHVDKLRSALDESLGRTVTLRIQRGAARLTAAAREAAARAARQRQAEQTIAGDPFVQSLIRDFGARVDSIRPAQLKNV